ncbi:hypothetical protein BOTBODRAFT_244101 [Botryobasidium botryosum FD-172 SS1]|uniref:Uncharacterized protein n=1 Tax=Botryobasidium botryosum (strain FD-172 SS1) TaxID=930990 RepID=A0A067LWK9_BOTB1|nr:hypothetical protein BOTBODRAFT_244101 [Botryobasidium botryosum FD-172 SS1]
MALRDALKPPPPIVLSAPAVNTSSLDESRTAVTSANLGRAPCTEAMQARPTYKKWQHLDLLKTLLGSNYQVEDGSVNLAHVDPRLWAILLQVYANLPPFFLRYNIPLGDKWLPLLQRVEPSNAFTLIVTLDLSSQRALTDDNIVNIKSLHQLSTFDCSGTRVTNCGVERLSKTLLFRDGVQKIGPWKLRVWYLKRCTFINDAVARFLASFPLLCLVDLRESGCRRPNIISWDPRKSGPHKFHVCTPSQALRQMAGEYPMLMFPSPSKPFALHVRELSYSRKPPRAQPTAILHGGYVAISHSNKIRLGHAEKEAWRQKEDEKLMQQYEWEERMSSRYQTWDDDPPEPCNCHSSFWDGDYWECTCGQNRASDEEVISCHLVPVMLTDGRFLER